MITTNDPDVLLEYLLCRRKTLGHTQAGVSTQMGISSSTLWRMETGRLSPSLWMLQAYAEALDVKLTWGVSILQANTGWPT